MDNLTGGNKLRRKLGFWAALGGSVGLVLSGTAMVSVGQVAGAAGSASWLPAIIAMIPMAAVACAFGELTAMFPGGGMLADYTMPALGKFWAIFVVLSGYVLVIMLDGGNQLTVAGLTLGNLTHINYLVFVAIMLALILAINLFGVQFYGKMEASLTLIMMVIYFAFGIMGCLGVGESLGIAKPINEITPFNPESGWSAAIGCTGTAIWWYIGFEYICPMAEENKKPHKNIPKALLIGMFMIFMADLLFVYGSLKYVNVGELLTSTAPQIDMAEGMLGHAGNIIVTIITIMAAFTSVVAHLSAIPRMMYGLAYKGLVPKAFAFIHPKYRTPWVGIFFTAIIIICAVVFMAVKGPDANLIITLINVATTTYLIAYFVAVLDVFIYRRKHPDFPRLWKSPGGVPLMILGILGIIYCLWSMRSVWPAAIIAIAVIAILICIWLKYKKIPFNEKEPLTALVKSIQERSEELPEWDQEVNEWLKKHSEI